MFALDCEIYRGTQACFKYTVVYSEHFFRVIYYDRSSLWYIRKRTRGYRVILTLNLSFLHHIIRKSEKKLCQSPCRHHVLLSNFHNMRCNTWNIKKKKKFSEWFDEIVSHRSRNLNMYKRPFEYLLKKWSSTLYPSGK